MNPLLVLYPLTGILIMAAAFWPALWLTRRFALPWRLWGIGAATFFLSQAGHIPFNWLADRLLKARIDFSAWTPTAALLFSAVFAGLSAGLWEELARYAMFRWWAKDARDWRTALMTGAGHGGLEALLVGGLSLVAFFQLLALRGVDMSALVPADALTQAQMQVAAYWSAPWWQPFMGLLERLFALCIQLSLAVLMVQVFRRGQLRWLWLAVGYHALVDALAVFLVHEIGFWVEAVIGGLALFSLWMIFNLRDDDRPLAAAAAAPVMSLPLDAVPLDAEDDLDSARYQS